MIGSGEAAGKLLAVPHQLGGVAGLDDAQDRLGPGKIDAARTRTPGA